MDVKNFLIPKREHLPTIRAKDARSTMKLVEVMLVTEFKLFLTQQFRKRLESKGNREKRIQP